MKGSVRTMLRQALCSALAAIGMALATSDGQGAEGPAMTFELVEGHGPLGLTRWIQASGVIEPRTETDFDAFAARHDLSGLTIAFHSRGGNAGTAFRVARRIRALKLNAIVGQTFRPTNAVEPQAVLVASGAFCASACVFMFAGGVERTVLAAAVIGVHQSKIARGSDGDPVTIPLGDGSPVDDTSRVISYHLGSYSFWREMGIRPEIMRLIASTPFRSIRVLSLREVEQVGLGRPVRLDDPPEGKPLWFVSHDPNYPGLFWRTARVSTPSLRIDDEIRINCANNVAHLHYRVLPVRDTTGQRRTLTGQEVVLGSQNQQWSLTQGLALTELGLVMNRTIPLTVLAEAAALGRLHISASIDGVDPAPRDISEGFAAALAQLPATCRPTETPAVPTQAKSAPDVSGAEDGP